MSSDKVVYLEEWIATHNSKQPETTTGDEIQKAVIRCEANKKRLEEERRKKNKQVMRTYRVKPKGSKK